MGAIKIGQVYLRDIGNEQLYEYISIVFQQVQLYDDTILENIRIECDSATDADVLEACRAAHCHDFISRLPHGYQTRIGEGGACLSGVERQRLSIARALLKNAPILLLDEITTSVDSDSQYEIQKALSELAVGRTVIMLAHRLGTIVEADQIIVLDQEEIVEQGTHTALLNREGLYRKLWLAQHH